ncbi:MAG: hypothetical protein QOH84_6003 [Kribbellaceae bacterium]|nr:hypothetical protein [Kribbellaceae bacterium]
MRGVTFGVAGLFAGRGTRMIRSRFGLGPAAARGKWDAFLAACPETTGCRPAPLGEGASELDETATAGDTNPRSMTAYNATVTDRLITPSNI